MDDDENTTIAQWARAARECSRKAMLDAVGKSRQAKERFSETADRMEHAAEEYRRALLIGADLAPIPTVEVTVEAARLRTADQDG
jgi:hypothetical protein